MKSKNLKTLTLFFSFIALLFLNSCNNKSIHEVDSAFERYISGFTYGGITTDSYIQIELINDMPSVELNKDLEEKYFSFSPAIKGTTQWINANTIRFTPDPDELKPGTKYNCTFYLDKILKVEKKFKEFKFGVFVIDQSYRYDILPYSPVSNNNLESNRVEISLQVANPVSEDEVKNMFSLKNSNAKIIVQSLSKNNFKITLDDLLRNNNDNSYELNIDGTSIGAKKKATENIIIPKLSISNYKVVDIRMIQEQDPHIRITFSDPIETDQAIEDLINPIGIGFFTYNVDKNVIRIYPEVLPSDEVQVDINESLKNINGFYLDDNYSFKITVKPYKPEVYIEDDGNILPNANELNINFNAVNLWAVDVSVIKIYQNNILYFLQSNSLNENYQTEVRRFGRLVMKKRIRLDEDKSRDLSKPNVFSLDLSPMFEKDPGAFYIVKLSFKQDYSLYPCGGVNPMMEENINNQATFSNNISDEENETWDEQSANYYEQIDWDNYDWEESNDPCKASFYMDSDNSDSKTIMSSNIGMIAKISDNNKITVVTTDIITTNPISGANVKVYNYQLQEIGSGKTNNEGILEITYQNSQPFIVSATKGKDIGYLEVKNESSLSLSRFDVGGLEYQKGLKGYIYGERGIWRPGDTLHLTFILENKDNKLPSKHPVVLELYTPFGQLYTRKVETEGINGFYNFNVATDPSVTTGKWQAYIKVGGATFYKSLNIETIKPNRLKIILISDSIINAEKGIFSGSINAKWLHGAPASNLKSDVELTLSKINSPFKDYKKYTFNNPIVKFDKVTYSIYEGLLNSNGTAQINSKISLSENAPGMLSGNILSKVYETGGDMSFYSQNILYSPYSSYVGIKIPENENSRFLETDKPFNIDIVTVNMYGNKINRNNLEYKIYKLNWSWWWNSSSEDLGTYTNNTAVVPIRTGTLSTQNGQSKVSFQVDYPEWGRYLILVKDPDSGHTSGEIFYVDWPDWRGKSAKVDPEGLSMLSFSTDKQNYKVGENVNIIIPKSSDGRALISLEKGSSIIQKQWVKTSANEDTKYSFKVTKEMTPNIYIFITLIQPHSNTINDLPIRMYGVVNINIENENSKLIPKISMPAELKPEKDFNVTISESTGKPMTYTLAIVDDGLLDITAFKTPNAWDAFNSKEALGVRTWDLFDRVIGANALEIGSLLSIGGDEALKSSSDKVNRFKPVVKFLGPFTIKANEKKSHKITMPQYVGSVRVMVVAGNDGAYGNAEKTVPVKNALMTLSTLPRVMGLNEEVLLPVNIFAMEPKVKDVTISVETDGLLKVIGSPSQKVTFNTTGDKIVYFNLKASNKIGAEQVKIKAVGGGENSSEIINIGIRNPNLPVVRNEGSMVDVNSTVNLTLSTDNISPYDWAKIEFSRIPSINFNKNIELLTNSDYTSTEHITSKAFPLLYIDKLVKLDDADKKKYTDIITQSIQNLALRQKSDGGFSYWPKNTYTNEWITSYTGNFLIEAKKNGYNVQDKILNNWLKYQQKLARNWTRTSGNGGYYNIYMTELQQAYRLYTLALYGKAEQGAMNRMKEIKDLSLQAKWRLAAAYAIINKANIANDIVFNLKDKIEDYDFNNSTFGSYARDNSMIMETYLLLGKTEKALELSYTVADKLSSDYVSSQEAAFGIMAMAKLADKMGVGTINAEWTINGKKMKNLNIPDAFYQQNIKPDTNITIQITNKGNVKFFARLISQTIPINDIYVPTESVLKLSINYTDKKGKPIDIARLKQGTEIVATAIIENVSHKNFNDVVLAQIFPSGWEIYNDRVIDITDDNSNIYNYRDFRDDRVLTHFNINTGQKIKVTVNLQAAYKGKYYFPSAICMALYNPADQAKTPGKWVEVID